jgi:hypothetical protein
MYSYLPGGEQRPAAVTSVVSCLLLVGACCNMPLCSVVLQGGRSCRQSAMASRLAWVQLPPSAHSESHLSDLVDATQLSSCIEQESQLCPASLTKKPYLTRFLRLQKLAMPALSPTMTQVGPLPAALQQAGSLQCVFSTVVKPLPATVRHPVNLLCQPVPSSAASVVHKGCPCLCSMPTCR